MNQYKKKIAISKGGLYFLKDEFFDQVLDKNLMQNKDTGRRPHYIIPSSCEKINGEPVYWAIPLTSKVEKYEKIKEQRLKEKEKCNDFHIISLTNGMTSVFLLCNMFPVTGNYLACDYRTEKGIPVGIRRNKDRQEIEEKFKIIRKLISKGKAFHKKQPNANAIMRKLRLLQICSLELKDLVFLDGVTRIPYPDTSINLYDQICLIEQGYFPNRNDNTYGLRRLLPVHLKTAMDLKAKGYKVLYLKDGIEISDDCWPFIPNVFCDDIFLVRASDISEIYRKSHVSRRRRLADKRQQKRQNARNRYRKENCHVL